MPKNSSVLNNLAVLKARSTPDGLEDPWTATQVLGLLKDSSALETESWVARTNRAQLLNFYGLFAPAKKIWEQAQTKVKSPVSEDGLGVALQGSGNSSSAKAAFSRATELGASPKRFAHQFHGAAVSLFQDPETCLEQVSEMSERVGSFEKNAFDKLEETCRSWKQRKAK